MTETGEKKYFHKLSGALAPASWTKTQHKGDYFVPNLCDVIYEWSLTVPCPLVLNWTFDKASMLMSPPKLLKSIF